MDRISYFKKAVKAGACYYKTWLIDAMAIVDLPAKPEIINPEIMLHPGLRGDEPARFPHEEHPYQLFQFNKDAVFYDPETEQWTAVEGYKQGVPFFSFKEEISLVPGDLANVDRNLTTWIGNVLVNQCVLCYPFGDTIPFQQGNFSIKAVEAIIAEKLTSLPEDPNAVRDKTKIYVDILEKYYYDAAYSLSGWTQLAIPAATPYTLMTDPNIRKRRLELLKEYEDQLDDPTIIAKIMGELIQMDKNFQANDPEGGYLQPGKSFDIVRAKALLMYGIETDPITGKVILIDRPLSEGWDLEQLPYMINSLVTGSFGRGAMTALGGEAAKFIARFFMNTTISMDDCGVKYGMSRFISKKSKDGYLGASVVGPAGKAILISNDNFAEYADTVTEVFSPQYCQAGSPNFCTKCIGQRYKEKPDSLGANAVDLGSTIMLIMMKLMHGVAIKTMKWNWAATAE